MDLLIWLQDWYKSMCDGDWEHVFGVKIDTLDNPGWTVSVNIADTSLENKPFNDIHNYVSDDDWMHCTVKDGKFCGDGDSGKLIHMLEIFRKLANS